MFNGDRILDYKVADVLQGRAKGWKKTAIKFCKKTKGCTQADVKNFNLRNFVQENDIDANTSTDDLSGLGLHGLNL